MKAPPRVCVVGAGCSGLVALKALKDRAIPAECFERSEQVGGLWVLQTSRGKSSAYRSLHINTSRERSEFRDFPMPAHYPDYPHHSQMAAYFDAYAERFGLKPLISFRVEVERVRRLEDGSFEVRVAGEPEKRFDAVVVANGHHSDPYFPDESAIGRFDGPQIHARDYADPDDPLPLRGARVLVVGMGNSAMDISSELAYAGCRVVLSARRGAYIVPKWVLGKPVDQGSLLPRWLPARLRRRISQKLLEAVAGKAEDYGLPSPDHGLGGAHPTLSNELFSLLRARRVVAKPQIERFQGKTVLFVDGTRSEIDAVVFCTGYNVRFPFFDESFLSAPENELGLFMRVHEPDTPNLFFVGLCQPVGAIMPIAEAQARWVADCLAGTYELPERVYMRRAVAAERRHLHRRYVPSRRHTMQVDFDDYLRALSTERARGSRRAKDKKQA